MNKFCRSERQHILKKAIQLTSFTDCPNIGKFTKLFRSNHSFFMIFKEPQWQPCMIPDSNSEDYSQEQELKQKLNNKVEISLADDEVDNPPKMEVKSPALNIFEYLIQRDKPINLFELKVIVYDLLVSL